MKSLLHVSDVTNIMISLEKYETIFLLLNDGKMWSESKCLILYDCLADWKYLTDIFGMTRFIVILVFRKVLKLNIVSIETNPKTPMANLSKSSAQQMAHYCGESTNKIVSWVVNCWEKFKGTFWKIIHFSGQLSYSISILNTFQKCPRSQERAFTKQAPKIGTKMQ